METIIDQSGAAAAADEGRVIKLKNHRSSKDNQTPFRGDIKGKTQRNSKDSQPRSDIVLDPPSTLY